jgi:hypothetical protein
MKPYHVVGKFCREAEDSPRANIGWQAASVGLLKWWKLDDSSAMFVRSSDLQVSTGSESWVEGLIVRPNCLCGFV